LAVAFAVLTYRFFQRWKVLSAGARNLRWTMQPQPAEERQRSLALALDLRWPARELLGKRVGGEGQESLGEAVHVADTQCGRLMSDPHLATVNSTAV